MTNIETRLHKDGKDFFFKLSIGKAVTSYSTGAPRLLRT